MYQTLISAQELAHISAEHLVLLDCCFRLEEPDYGWSLYETGHLPNAHYLNLEDHLSGKTTGSNGRHPLPDRTRLAFDLGAIGITPKTQVVAYDTAVGQYAARAWWLLRWLGHRAVAVLDGGVQEWKQAGYDLTDLTPERRPFHFLIQPGLEETVDTATVLSNIDHPTFTLVDARSRSHYRGEVGTLDPVLGHIPGAVNRFFMHNVNPDKRFKRPEQLRAEWHAVLGEVDPANSVHQCGSGVTACHNLLSIRHAGFEGARLYPGSWSEWCSDPTRPVQREISISTSSSWHRHLQEDCQSDNSTGKDASHHRVIALHGE